MLRVTAGLRVEEWKAHCKNIIRLRPNTYPDVKEIYIWRNGRVALRIAPHVTGDGGQHSSAGLRIIYR